MSTQPQKSKEAAIKGDNPFIHSGYRANKSYKKLLLSIFMIHNETFNIWTHLFGLILFFGLLVYTVKNIASLMKMSDVMSLVNEIDRQVHVNLDKISVQN